jgi:hypothetical protein
LANFSSVFRVSLANPYLSLRFAGQFIFFSSPFLEQFSFFLSLFSCPSCCSLSFFNFSSISRIVVASSSSPFLSLYSDKFLFIPFSVNSASLSCHLSYLIVEFFVKSSKDLSG